MPASGANPAVDVGSRLPVVDRWPSLLLVAGVLGFVGSLLHPMGDPTLSGDAAVAAEIGDPLWTPSHLLILVFVALLVPGFLGLAVGRRGRRDRAGPAAPGPPQPES